MLFPHIIYLHAGQLAECQGLLDRKSRIIGVHVHFYHVIIRYTDDGITDGT